MLVGASDQSLSAGVSFGALLLVAGGPPRDADLPGATLVTCAVSACAMEVDITDLVKDEYFAAVLTALEQQVQGNSPRNHLLRVLRLLVL